MAEGPIPVVREHVEVGKRRRTTGVVRVRKHPVAEREAVEVELAREVVEVRRVPADRLVDGPVPDRQEGDTTVISVLAEVPVVEKRLKVVEEIHLVRRHTVHKQRRHVLLRHDEVRVERD